MNRITVGLLIGIMIISSAGCSRWLHRRYDKIEVQLHSEPSEEATGEARKKLRKAVRHIEHDKLQLAEKELLAAIQLAPTLGPAHNNLGLVYYQRRQLYDASHAYQRAVELMPGDPAPLNNLGLTCEQGDRIEDAVMHYQEAHLLDPTNPIFLGNLIRARLRRGDQDDSVFWMLRDLVFLETRPEWVDWARQELCITLPRVKGEVDPELCSLCNISSTGPANRIPGSQSKADAVPTPGKVQLPPLPGPTVSDDIDITGPRLRLPMDHREIPATMSSDVPADTPPLPVPSPAPSPMPQPSLLPLEEGDMESIQKFSEDLQ